jgi:triacylglycerol lipase
MSFKLQYPILFVHGMGFRDHRHLCYWGRIPKTLEQMGCTVFFGNQDSNADIETNGCYIAQRIDQIIKETGAEKVNIIAHSKGGLDSRYAISILGAGDKVASLTTISTPHHGSKTVDKLIKIPKFLLKFGCFFVDCWFRILGDKKPNTYSAIHSLTTSAASEFNARVCDFEEVYYQSYAFVMKKPTSDIFLMLTNVVVDKIEGENDGLLTPDAVKWGDFKGVFKGVGRRGISHCDEVDMRRMPLSKKTGDGVSDIIDVYKDIVMDLQNRGF